MLLFERVRPFASVVHGPVCIDAVAAVVRGFAFAGGDVVAADDGAARAVRTVHDTLADITAQGGEEIRFCRLTSSWVLSTLIRFRRIVILCSSA